MGAKHKFYVNYVTAGGTVGDIGFDRLDTAELAFRAFASKGAKVRLLEVKGDKHKEVSHV